MGNRYIFNSSPVCVCVCVTAGWDQFNRFVQCFVTGSILDPYLKVFLIQIRIQKKDLDTGPFKNSIKIITNFGNGLGSAGRF